MTPGSLRFRLLLLSTIFSASCADSPDHQALAEPASRSDAAIRVIGYDAGALRDGAVRAGAVTARETELDAGRALEPSSDAAVSQVVDAASAAPQPGPALDASGPPTVPAPPPVPPPVPDANTPKPSPVDAAADAAVPTPAPADAAAPDTAGPAPASSCKAGHYTGAFNGQVALGTDVALSVTGGVAFDLVLGADGKSLSIEAGTVTAADPGGTPVRGLITGRVRCDAQQLEQGRLTGTYGTPGSPESASFAGTLAGRYSSNPAALEGTWAVTVQGSNAPASGMFDAALAN